MQDPNDPNDSTPDPNKYDVLELTNYFTIEGIINLPTITSSTPRDEVCANWFFITSNYADLHPKLPDGQVILSDFAKVGQYWKRNDAGPANNWHNGADTNRDGSVDYKDIKNIEEQWLVDANSIR